MEISPKSRASGIKLTPSRVKTALQHRCKKSISSQPMANHAYFKHLQTYLVLPLMVFTCTIVRPCLALLKRLKTEPAAFKKGSRYLSIFQNTSTGHASSHDALTTLTSVQLQRGLSPPRAPDTCTHAQEPHLVHKACRQGGSSINRLSLPRSS